MNLREGTRRLALLLGIIGAVLGGFVSYLELDSVQDQRARHNRFERLASSEVVQQQRKILQAPPDFIPDPSDKWAVQADEFRRQQSEVNKGGIKVIHWNKALGVESIKTENGYLYPTPGPSAWEYLLVALFPILGFFIPWGAIRAIGWVLVGFIQRSQ